MLDDKEFNRCFVAATGMVGIDFGTDPISAQFIWRDGGVEIVIATGDEYAVVPLRTILISSCLHAERLFDGDDKKERARQAVREHLRDLLHYFETESEEYLTASQLREAIL